MLFWKEASSHISCRNLEFYSLKTSKGCRVHRQPLRILHACKEISSYI
jgi:hypothetical protein